MEGQQKKQQQANPAKKKRGKCGLIKIKPTNCCTSNIDRWSSKEIHNLNLALELAVNPTKDEHWEKIAEAVSKGCQKKRTGTECKTRAETHGLLQRHAAGPGTSVDDVLLKRNRTRATKAKGVQRPKKYQSCPELDNSFGEMHQKYYDDFFAAQESPLDSLDLDDSLVHECFAPPPQFGHQRRTRRPVCLIPIPTVEHNTSNEDSNQ